MTPEIYAKVAPYLTTYGTGQVNVNTAPVQVLRSIPGMTDAIIANILNQRSRGLRIASIAQLVPGAVPRAGGARRRAADHGQHPGRAARAGDDGNTNQVLATFRSRGGPEAEPTQVTALISAATTATVTWEQW